MTKRPLVFAAAVLLLPVGAALAASASATLHDPAGAPVGTASLTQTPNGVLVHVEATGITPGSHAFHIHETGQCDGSGGFASAGGHFALEHKHGFKVEGGPHPGDMPNVQVHDDGLFSIEVLNAGVSLEEGKQGYLLDADGSALVIHAGADDYRSQPSGDAGDRVACGVIEVAKAD